MWDRAQWRKRYGFLPAQRLHLFMDSLFKKIVELQQRQRKALHIQRTDQRRGANQIRDILFQCRMRQLFGQQRHLKRRDTTEVVDQHRKASFAGLRF